MAFRKEHIGPRKAFTKCRNCDQNHHALLCVRSGLNNSSYRNNTPSNNLNPTASSFRTYGYVVKEN